MCVCVCVWGGGGGVCVGGGGGGRVWLQSDLENCAIVRSSEKILATPLHCITIIKLVFSLFRASIAPSP